MERDVVCGKWKHAYLCICICINTYICMYIPAASAMSEGLTLLTTALRKTRFASWFEQHLKLQKIHFSARNVKFHESVSHRKKGPYMYPAAFWRRPRTSWVGPTTNRRRISAENRSAVTKHQLYICVYYPIYVCIHM